MKRIKVLILLILPLILIFSSCKKEVSINIKYGEGYSDVQLTLQKGSTISELDYVVDVHKRIVSFVDDKGNVIDKSTVIKENKNITAVWEYDKFKYVFYDSDRKTVLLEKEDIYGAEIIYPADPEPKVYEGYTLQFKKWSDDATVLTEDISFYAQYKRVNDQFTVEFLDYNGNTYSTMTVDYAGYINEEADPNGTVDTESEYYKFMGWYIKDTDELFDFNSQITSNVTLYPKNKRGNYITTELKDATISILGDSISTFYSSSSSVNSYYSGTNQYYYPTYSTTVVTVTKTWWYQTINGVGAKLGVNNSLSGSAAYGTGTQAGQSPTRLRTLANKGTPNIVFVYLSTNDNVNSHTVEQLESAYRAIIEYIQKNYVEDRNGSFIKPIVYLFQCGYSSYSGYGYTEARRVEFNEMFAELASEYKNVRLFDIGKIVTKDNYSQYLGDYLHYNADGMTAISTELIKQLKDDFGENKGKIRTNILNVNYYDDRRRRKNNVIGY